MTDRRNGSPLERTLGVTAPELARGLGYFSIALGLSELLAPASLTRALGMEGSEGLVQAYGLREIATGIGILSTENQAPYVWGRVGGDLLDLATLATALHDDNPRTGSVALALAAVAGVTALDVICATALGGEHRQSRSSARDYSDRSGLPRPAQAMRGAARDAPMPRDLHAPESMRSFSRA